MSLGVFYVCITPILLQLLTRSSAEGIDLVKDTVIGNHDAVIEKDKAFDLQPPLQDLLVKVVTSAASNLQDHSNVDINQNGLVKGAFSDTDHIEKLISRHSEMVSPLTSNIVENYTGSNNQVYKAEGYNQAAKENADDENEEADDNFYRAKSYSEDKDGYGQNGNQNNKEYDDQDITYEPNTKDYDNDDDNDDIIEGEEDDEWYNPGPDNGDKMEEEGNEKWETESYQWTEKEEDEDNDDPVTDDFDDTDDDDNANMVEEVVNDEIAQKNKPPTGPSSMVVFYTWMVVALLTVVIAVSTYQTRCKEIKVPCMSGRSGRDDKKRLLNHEYV